MKAFFTDMSNVVNLEKCITEIQQEPTIDKFKRLQEATANVVNYYPLVNYKSEEIGSSIIDPECLDALKNWNDAKLTLIWTLANKIQNDSYHEKLKTFINEPNEQTMDKLRREVYDNTAPGILLRRGANLNMRYFTYVRKDIFETIDSFFPGYKMIRDESFLETTQMFIHTSWLR